MSELHPKRAVAAPGPLRSFKATLAGFARSVVSSLDTIVRMGPSSLVVRSPNVARELRAVKSGTDEFERTSGVRGDVDYIVRRNTHRLEKGMICRRDAPPSPPTTSNRPWTMSSRKESGRT